MRRAVLGTDRGDRLERQLTAGARAGRVGGRDRRRLAGRPRRDVQADQHPHHDHGGADPQQLLAEHAHPLNTLLRPFPMLVRPVPSSVRSCSRSLLLPPVWLLSPCSLSGSPVVALSVYPSAAQRCPWPGAEFDWCGVSGALTVLSRRSTRRAVHRRATRKRRARENQPAQQAESPQIAAAQAAVRQLSRRRVLWFAAMAKDTEKLIRQLSLISYLMAERRPVTALEIRRDVEGYSGMNEDAFARRFYADRSELESLRIQLTVERPADGAAEQENYSLRPENFHLPPIAFTDKELAALQTALSLLDGEFAYAEPLRLALQQITWGRPSPLRAPEQRSVALGITASAGGHDLSARLAKVETAIFRNKTILFDYYTMERDEVGPRRVDPYHLLFQGGQFYLLGHAHEREAIRVFRLSRIRGKVSYATKAEHDFRRPADFDPRAYANRADWQLGEERGCGRDPHLRADRLADRAPLRPLRGDPGRGR